MPADLLDMMTHALQIISWQENLDKDEMPPYWKWHLDWEIEEHFIGVRNARALKYGTADADPSVLDEGYERNALFDEFGKD